MIDNHELSPEQEENLRKINLENNKARFESLGKEGQEDFYLSLLKPNLKNGKTLLPDQARNIVEKFKSGEAGSVEDALKILKLEEDKDKRPFWN